MLGERAEAEETQGEWQEEAWHEGTQKGLL